MRRYGWVIAAALVWGALAVPGSGNEIGKPGGSAINMSGNWWQRLPAAVRRLVERRTNGDILSPPNPRPASEPERPCGKRACGQSG